MKNSDKIRLITITSLFTTIVFITTSFVKIPLALGYIHIGDVFIMLSSFMLPPFFAVVSAVIGSVFADLLAGFAIYMPITLLAKGLMALIASLMFYKKTTILRFLLGGILGSIVMVASYFVFEGFVYGWAPAIANLPMQFIQPAVAIVVGGIIIFAIRKLPMVSDFKSKISQKSHQKAPKDTQNGDC